jgi:sigma-B regulation protein RsbU (phosphoserine phosphatase)
VTRDLRATRLPPEPDSVSAARRFAAQAVSELGGPAEATCEVQLLVSELATNAVVHAGTPMRLSVLGGPQGLRVEVRDDDPTVPASPSAMPSPTATGGRGILLVDAIADHWGVNRSEKGKTIWFELDRVS